VASIRRLRVGFEGGLIDEGWGVGTGSGLVSEEWREGWGVVRAGGLGGQVRSEG
jgi:hypothetical protein